MPVVGRSWRRLWLTLAVCILVASGGVSAGANVALPLSNRTDLDYGIEVTTLSGSLPPVRAFVGVPALVDATGDPLPDLLVTVTAMPAFNAAISGFNDLVAPGEPGVLPLLPEGEPLPSGIVVLPGLPPLPPALPTADTHAGEIAIARLAAAPLPVRVELVFVVNGQVIRVGYDGRRSTAPGGFNATARIQADNRRLAVRTALADAGADLGIAASLRPLPGEAGPSFNAALRFTPVPGRADFMLTQSADATVDVKMETDRAARLDIEQLRFTEPPPPSLSDPPPPPGDGTTTLIGVVDQLPTTLNLKIRSAGGRPEITYSANADVARIHLGLTRQEPNSGSRADVALGLTGVTARVIDFLMGADQSLSVCAGSSPEPCAGIKPATGGIGVADFSVAIDALPLAIPLPRPARDYVRAVVINPHAPQLTIAGHVEGVNRFVLRPGERISAQIEHTPGSLRLDVDLRGQLTFGTLIDAVPALASFTVATKPQLRVSYDGTERSGAPARIRSIMARADSNGRQALFGKVRHVQVAAGDVPSHLVLETVAPREGATRETHLRFDTWTAAAPNGDPVGSVELSLFDDHGIRPLPPGVDGVRYYEEPAPRVRPGYSLQGRARGLRHLDFSTRSTCSPTPGRECQELVDAELDTIGGQPARVDLQLPRSRTQPNGVVLNGSDRVVATVDALPADALFNLTSTGVPGSLAAFVPSETKTSWNASATTPGLTLYLDLFEGARTIDPLRIAPLPANLKFCNSVDIRCLPQAEFDQYFRPGNPRLPHYRQTHSAFTIDARGPGKLGSPINADVSTRLCTSTRIDGSCTGDLIRIPGLRLSRIKYYKGPRLENQDPSFPVRNDHLILDTDDLPVTGRVFLGVDPSATLSLFANGLHTQNRVITTSVFDFYGAGRASCPSGTRVFAAGFDVTLKFCGSDPPKPI